MKKTILAIAAAATIAAGTLAAPTTADAQRCRGCVVGGAILGGALLGAAIANSQPRYYGPEPGYVVYDGYARDFPYDCPGGYWARKPIAFNAYGEPIRWSRPRPVCP
ncbi:MAG: hypothetical protein HY244_15110 [Rhizobiales bacterium]|nr:hypothetical protein [Hyphomicrobiales bacterium]